jgi:HlyD family secretion protein
MKKRFFRILVVVLVVATVIFSVRWYRDKEEEDAGGNLKIYGTIDIRDASLAFNEQERISEVLVEEGDRVQAGQTLARLKTDRLTAQISEVRAQAAAQQEVVKRFRAGSRPQEIDQARAEVEAARTTVHNAEQVLERLQKTSGSGATSQQDLDDARSRLLVETAQLEVKKKALNLVLEGPRREDVAAAEKRLEALQADLSLLHIRLEDMTLKAPTAGVIESRILEPGEMAGPTRPVFILALTDPKWVRAYIPEPQLGRIRLGMRAKVLSDSFPDQTMDGWVGFISPIAEFTPKTVATEELRTQLVYEARIFVHDDQDRLRLGMPVTVLVDENAPVKASGAAAPPSETAAPVVGE